MRSARPRRQRLVLLRRPIENGQDIIDRQMTPAAAGFREPQGHGAEPAGVYGGGTSPLKTRDTIFPDDHGKLAEWSGDGFLRISRKHYPADPPTDGQVYGWQAPRGWVAIGAGGSWLEAPNDGRDYVRRGSEASWQPLPYVLPESPGDGQGYVRVGSSHAWRPAFTQAAADARYAPITQQAIPESPQTGLIYGRRGWDHAWVPIATGAGSPVAVVGAVPPLAPVDGALWFDVASRRLMIAYQGQWVVANGTG